jgi:hypothetical protein
MSVCDHAPMADAIAGTQSAVAASKDQWCWTGPTSDADPPMGRPSYSNRVATPGRERAVWRLHPSPNDHQMMPVWKKRQGVGNAAGE